MTGTPDTPPQGLTAEERERVLAAEFSLGLLEGEELLAARGRMASDPDFAWRRQWWDDWFVPLTDDVAGAEPGAHVWDAINARITAQAASGAGEASNVVLLDMERRVRRWQWTAGIATAAAALALALFAASPGVDPVPDSAPRLAAGQPQPPLMASIPVGDTLRLSVTFLPGTDEMLVSAAGFTADGVHDHELWLVPADGGTLQSLGVVVPGEARRVTLTQDVVDKMGDGVELVLTREPLGGKPAGVDAGPVVAQGAFGAV